MYCSWPTDWLIDWLIDWFLIFGRFLCFNFDDHCQFWETSHLKTSHYTFWNSILLHHSVWVCNTILILNWWVCLPIFEHYYLLIILSVNQVLTWCYQMHLFLLIYLFIKLSFLSIISYLITFHRHITSLTARLSCATSGAKIYYSLDGSTPNQIINSGR